MNWRGKILVTAQALPVVIDSRLAETLDTRDTANLDTFLFQELRLLRQVYALLGDPKLVYSICESISRAVTPFHASKQSFQYSKLQALLGEMLLTQGKDANTLIRANAHLEEAVEVLEKVSETGQKVLAAYVDYSLQIGVIKKAMGSTDDSLGEMRKVAKDLAWNHEATKLDVVPLQRQEVIMLQTIAGHQTLFEGALSYRDAKPLEYYRSLKRIFEFVLNKGNSVQASMVYPEFKRAYVMVRSRLTPLSHVSFLKNIGQYLILKGDQQGAEKILTRTLEEAVQRNLFGQVRQIQHMVDESKSGEYNSKLITFRV